MPRPREAFTEAEAALLRRHATSLVRDVYCVRDLPPEVTAVLFAYVSRSPKSFRRNLLELLQSGELDMRGVGDAPAPLEDEDADAMAAAGQRAKAFHEKWVVGYGHSSVAEHADLKYAIEACSIHAAKFLEDNRLGSYTEKSTRYQIIDADDFDVPEELNDRPELRGIFVDSCRALFEAYGAFQQPLRDFVAKEHPRRDGTSERAYESSLKAKVCDIARHLLPAATRTALGVSFNARTAERAIAKCLSHPLAEIRALGQAMLDEGRKICPALLKRAASDPYLVETREKLAALVAELLPTWDGFDPQANYVSLERDEPDAEQRVLAAILYEHSASPWSVAMEKAKSLGEADRDRLLDAFFGGMGKFDWPTRACEHAVFQMDMLVDYGAFRDIQRHRMATLTEQPTTCRHCFVVPAEIAAAGLEAPYRAAMDKSADAWDALRKELPHVAPLVVAQGFRKRVVFSWNLRELEHFIRLRSAKQGHIAYRKVAQECHRLMTERHPRLAKYLRCDHDNHILGRLEAEERDEQKRQALAAKSA
jgi:thymidylate synthase ThyX